MRELPEIELLRRELERELAGRRVTEAEVTVGPAVTHTRTKKAFTDQLAGAQIDSVRRRGLYLVVTLDTERALVVRVGDDGGFRRGDDRTGAALSLTFSQGAPVHLVDLGKDGELYVAPVGEVETAVPALAAPGFDPLDEPMTWVRFSERLSRRSDPLKRLLLDQNFVLGLGDVYVDEVLFEAGVRYDRRCDTLSTQEVRRLYRSLIEVLHDAIKHGGAHLGEHGIRDLAGKPGEHQEHLQVWGREGKRSPRSRTPIKRVKYEGHWTFYCDTQV